MNDDNSGGDKSRQRLGRGLASLIGGGGGLGNRPVAGNAGGPSTANAGGDRNVATAALRPNPDNPRRTFDEADLADLAVSIRTHGVVQPILVRPATGAGGEGARFEIVAGERRWRAARLAGLANVPIVVRELSDRETLEIAIIENVQRADLDAMEEAEAYDRLITEHGYSQGDLADALGKSRSHVANTLRLLKLPETVRRMVSAGELSPGHARAALAVENPEGFARTVAAEGLTVREAESRARTDNAPPSGRPRAPARKPVSVAVPEAPAQAAPKRPEVELVERALSDDLGFTVFLDPPGEGDTLHIRYGSAERLGDLVRLLKLAAGHRRDPRIRQL